MRRITVPIFHRKRESALTRTDLLFVMCGLFLLLGFVWPLLAATTTTAQQATCLSNLQQIGVAFGHWAEEHGQRLPWRVSQEEGGVYGTPSVNFAWVHYYFLTNELKTPKVLACPADEVKPSTHWGQDTEDGYLHRANRGRALSYIVGIDARPESPQSILSGDRNLDFSARDQNCDYASARTAASLAPGVDSVQWQESVHQSQGNILFQDGSVEPTDSVSLRKLLPKTEAFHRQNHVLVP